MLKFSLRTPIFSRPSYGACMFALKRHAALTAIATLVALASLFSAGPFAAAPDSGTYLVYTGGIFGRLDPCG